MGKLDKLLNNVGNVSNTAGAVIGGVQAVKSLFGNQRKEERNQDARQIDMQRRLNEENTKANKALADYEQQLKMQMWKDTNYGAQMNEATKAGLSKVAVLGGSGGGAQGASVGTSGIGSGASGSAQSEMARTQAELAKAQTANLNANTMKTTAEAKKIEGVDTGNVQANTNLTTLRATAQDIENKFQQWKNDDAEGMGQSQAKRELLLTLNKTQGELRNMEQEFKNMGVDFNNIQASTEKIKSDTALRQQLKQYLENANPVQIALLKTASEMSDRQLKKFKENPANTKTGMYIDYGMDKVKDIVDMGTDIYGAKTFRQLIEKEPTEQTTTTEETIEHPNGTTTNRYQRQRRK